MKYANIHLIVFLLFFSIKLEEKNHNEIKEKKMKEEWLLIENGALTPAINMAIDEKLTDWHREKKLPPILRFYEWAPAGLSVGYFQRTDGKINKENVKKHGFEMVRRQTGGQAVLHDHELTYSFVIDEKHPSIPKTILSAHKTISEALLMGLNELNVAADFAEPIKKHSQGTAICFEEPSWYEITWQQKKLIGSAQARLQGVLLQHGSIPLTQNEDVLFDLFIFANEKIRERMKRAFSKKAVGLYEALQEEIDIKTVRRAFQKGFEAKFNISLKNYTFSKKEWEEIEKLAKQKYENADYVLMR